MLAGGSYGPGSGPIYLSELECSGSESLLSSCLSGHNLPPGLVNCDHSMDVSIQCQGNSVISMSSCVSIVDVVFFLSQIMMSAVTVMVGVSRCATTL